MDKETAIKKIQKCMALAKSSEPHEAAAQPGTKTHRTIWCRASRTDGRSISEDWSKSASSKTPHSMKSIWPVWFVKYSPVI
jgi:hypothetical protein